jgi:hypothetical protein
MIKTVTLAAAQAALVCAGPALPHHSSSMFDLSQPIWLEGTVVIYEPINPHTRFVIEQREADGRVQQWTVEGPSLNGQSLNTLTRRGVPADLLKPGDVIAVCGFALTDAVLARAPPPNRPRYPTAFVHGHLLVMPDGGMLRWGSYGKLENCVRSTDQPQTWADYVNADERAREMWCRSHRMVNIASATPKALVDAIDSLMTNPCN